MFCSWRVGIRQDTGHVFGAETNKFWALSAYGNVFAHNSTCIEDKVKTGIGEIEMHIAWGLRRDLRSDYWIWAALLQTSRMRLGS